MIERVETEMKSSLGLMQTSIAIIIRRLVYSITIETTSLDMAIRLSVARNEHIILFFFLLYVV